MERRRALANGMFARSTRPLQSYTRFITQLLQRWAQNAPYRPSQQQQHASFFGWNGAVTPSPPHREKEKTLKNTKLHWSKDHREAPARPRPLTTAVAVCLHKTRIYVQPAAYMNENNPDNMHTTETNGASTTNPPLNTKYTR